MTSGGEETGYSLTGHPWCWVVDPNDGTSDFLKGLKGSAISVGLLRDHVPVLGVVYAPVTVEGFTDCIAWAEGERTLLRNGQASKATLITKALSQEAQVMVSSAAVHKPELNKELCAPCRFVAMPSIAYRRTKDVALVVQI